MDVSRMDEEDCSRGEEGCIRFSGKFFWPPDSMLEHATAVVFEEAEILSSVERRPLFPSVTHLLAIKSFGQKGPFNEHWLSPDSFPNLKYFWTDGCAIGMIDHYKRGGGGEQMEEQMEQSVVLGDAFGMQGHFVPSHPFKIIFPVTRRVPGLGARSFRAQGSPQGWSIEIELDESPDFVLGTRFQLFQHYNGGTFGEQAESEHDEYNGTLLARSQANKKTLDVSWDALLVKDGANLPWDKTPFADVVVVHNGEKIAIDADKRSFAAAKAMFELLGLRPFGIAYHVFSKGAGRNSNLTLVLCSRDLDLLRADLKQAFQQK